ncbi:MAG: hypothetical protein ACTHKC_08710 [Candidatus Nitrosocosmicus sp.]
MTLYQFNALNETNQAEAIWNGMFLTHREDRMFRILLYQIDSFYVEVYYQKQKNFLSHFRAFTTTRLLEPYLDQIDLTGKF